MFLLGAIAFGCAYGMLPLFSQNQHCHFLVGLARARFGYLDRDVMAHKTDPFPAFSWLVATTHRYLSDSFFYVYYLLLFGAYIQGLLATTDRAGPRRRAPHETVAVFAILTLLHSETVGYALFGLNHLQWWQLTHWGVAEQEIFGHGAFQASSFGMLLPASIALALAGRFEIAALLAGAVVDMHFSYWLSVGALTGAYTILAWRRGGPTRAVWTALAAVVVTMPAVVYVGTHFAPTANDTAQHAAAILASHVPQEAVPAVWVGPRTAVQLGIVAAALLLVRQTDLFLVLASLTVAGLAGSIGQLVTGSQAIALLFPWRVSVLAVPLSTAVLANHAVLRASRWRWTPSPRIVTTAAATMVALLALAGIVRMAVHFTYFYNQPSARAAADRWLPTAIANDFRRDLASDRLRVFAFVSNDKRPDDLYLVPTSFTDFRLRTGAPIFADWSTIAYRDVEVLAWKTRYDEADQFFRRGDCRDLEALARQYAISHVVFDRRRGATSCEGALTVYADERYEVVRLSGPRARPDGSLR